MKTTILGIFLLPVAASGFVSPTRATARQVTLVQDALPTDDIVHELEELGEEIKPHLMHEKHGFNEFHESLVHKLRRAVREKDKVYHQALHELEKREKNYSDMDLLLQTLRDIQTQLQKSKVLTKDKAQGTPPQKQVVLDKGQNQALMDLRNSLERIEKDLVESRAFATAWQIAEVELYNEHAKSEEEHESLRFLVGQALRLAGRRVKNGVLRVVTLGWWKPKKK